MTTAENLKASGALQYKARNFKEAIALFKKASELEPTVVVYLSNLSAAQYEDGQYRAASETCVRVLDILPADDTLRARISTRLAKAQSYLSHDDQVGLDTPLIEFTDAARVEALKRQALAKKVSKDNLVNQRIMSLPRYRHSPSSDLEYFSIGHDIARSMLRTQDIDDDDDSSLHLKLPGSAQFEFSAFFCGIGDARHLYGTLLDIDHTYEAPISKGCTLHFTTVDINATVLARNLIVQLALNELSLLENPSAPRARHLLLMLHYVYLATVMPPLAARILAELTERVDKLLSLAVKRGVPLNLGWLHVAAKSCAGILNTVKWWLTTGKTVVTYTDMLTRREDSTPPQSDTVPNLAHHEYVAYEYLRVLVPPSDCDEPDVLEELVFEPIRNGQEDKIPPSQFLELIHEEHIAGRWSINYTKLSPDWYEERRREELSPFTTTSALFGDELDRISSTCPAASLYQITSDCFWRIGRGLKKLRDRFTVEVILGDGFAVMDGIRLKTFSRSPDFPILYDRIHASNVPDYAGGLLASFTPAVPIQKSHRQAYFTTADRVHAGSWEGDYKKEHLHHLGLSSRVYTYTGALAEEMAGAFGVELIGKARAPNSYHMFRPTFKVQLEAIATGCFFRTVLPARLPSVIARANFEQIKEVLNVHSFFRSLEIWKTLGYPLHILADLVEQILEDRLTSSVVPHDKTYVPLPPRGDRKLVPIRTQPFLADFEVAAALWEPKLFPISSLAMPSISGIRRYSIKIPRQELEIYARGHISSTQMVLLLVFGLPDDMDAVSMDVRQEITKSPQQWKSSLQFVSTFDYDCETSTCTLLLSRKRLDTFLENGYEAGLVNIIQWKLQSSKVPCSALQNVGDVDEWDKSIVVPDVEGRSMSRAQVGSWERAYAQAVNDYNRSRKLDQAFSTVFS